MIPHRSLHCIADLRELYFKRHWPVPWQEALAYDDGNRILLLLIKEGDPDIIRCLHQCVVEGDDPAPPALRPASRATLPWAATNTGMISPQQQAE